MRKQYIKVSLLVCSVLAVPSNAISNNGWILKKHKMGIAVYNKEVISSKYHATKAEMEIDSSIESLVSFMCDIKEYKDWYPDLKTIKVIKKVSNKEFYLYIVLSAPWPLTDRDTINHYRINYDKKNNKVTISFRGAENFLPEKKNYVRVKKVRGAWSFKKQLNGKTRVLYSVQGDPGGRLPAWLANRTLVDKPYRIMELIRQNVQKPRYKNTKLSLKDF